MLAYTYTNTHTYTHTVLYFSKLSNLRITAAVSLHIVTSYLTLTTPMSSLETKRRVNAFSKKVSTRNIT